MQFVHPMTTWWIDTVLGTWEETLKALVREVFAKCTRFINGVCSWVVALFRVDRTHYKCAIPGGSPKHPALNVTSAQPPLHRFKCAGAVTAPPSMIPASERPLLHCQYFSAASGTLTSPSLMPHCLAVGARAQVRRVQRRGSRGGASSAPATSMPCWRKTGARRLKRGGGRSRRVRCSRRRQRRARSPPTRLRCGATSVRPSRVWLPAFNNAH